MSRSVLLSLLAQGNTGAEILRILESIADVNDDNAEVNVEV